MTLSVVKGHLVAVTLCHMYLEVWRHHTLMLQLLLPDAQTSQQAELYAHKPTASQGTKLQRMASLMVQWE